MNYQRIWQEINDEIDRLGKRRYELDRELIEIKKRLLRISDTKLKVAKKLTRNFKVKHLQKSEK